jgi:hypothetical protein
MNPDKRKEILSRTAIVAPPSLTPQFPAAAAGPAGQGYEVVPHEDPAKVQASGRGVHLAPGTVKGMGGADIKMTQGAPQAASVNVRGAVPVAGAKTGATVQMQGASRQVGVRGATLVGQHGQPAPIAGIGPQPARQLAPVPNTSKGWSGAAIPTARPTGPAAPTVDLTIMLSQHARPNLIEGQRRALDSSTVQPAALACFINPAGIQLNDRALAGIATVRAAFDMGPWMRWTFATETTTKYVLILDDDCNPGINWIRLAIERLELAEQRGEQIIVACAGTMFQSDTYDDTYPIGPEAPRMDEVVADVGRGGWLMRREMLAPILAYPRLGTTPMTQRLAVPLHVAAALQDAMHSIVVLPFSPAEKSGWGMLEAPKQPDPGSTSAQIDVQAKANADYPSWWYRQDAYNHYRAAGGWEPHVVMAAASTVELQHSDFQSNPVPPPVAPPAKPKAAAAAPAPKVEEASESA